MADTVMTKGTEFDLESSLEVSYSGAATSTRRRNEFAYVSF